MRRSKAQVEARVHVIPTIRFEQEQRLTSFAGIVIIQALLQTLALKQRLWRCFRHLAKSAAYGLNTMMVWLIVHIMLGFRRLRDRDYYADDPLECRVLGLRKVPDVSTITRRLAEADKRSVNEVRGANRELVLGRLRQEQLRRITFDFDGSVLTTRGHAEGTAVGFNKKRKGGRSYYPLFCTVAQTGQFLDFHHRPGNVHDSNGARQFMLSCADYLRTACPGAQLESRMDFAFFDETILDQLASEGIDFTASVPFERFPELKALIEARRRWNRIDETWSYAELRWKPKSWACQFRMLAIRRRRARQRKGPLQLDLFEPRDYDYEYKVIVTNKLAEPVQAVLAFHNGRGGQEGLIGEAKSCAALEYIPMRRLAANQLYCAASLMAHNLGRELQMVLKPRASRNSAKRAALWAFESLGTLRHRLLQRAGRLTFPAGRMTLTMGGNERVRSELLGYLDAITSR